MCIRQVDLLAPFLLKAARPIELPAALSPQSMAKHVLVLALKTKITLGPEEIQVFHQLCQSQPPWPRSPPVKAPVKAPASTAARTQTRSVRWQQRCQEPARTSWPGAIFLDTEQKLGVNQSTLAFFAKWGFGQYTLGLCFLKLLVTGLEIQLAERSQQANKNWGIKATQRVIHRDNAVVWVLGRPFVRQSLNQVSLGGSGLGTLNSTLQT